MKVRKCGYLLLSEECHEREAKVVSTDENILNEQIRHATMLQDGMEWLENRAVLES